MAIPPSRARPVIGSPIAIAPGKGFVRPVSLPTQPAPTPSQQTSFVVASDTQPFSVAAGQTVVVTFAGIPTRSNNNVGPLQQQATTLALSNTDTLNFVVTLQNVTGTPPTASPRAVDTRNVRINTAILPGGNIYQKFQAVIIGAAGGASSGVVCGTLTLMR